MTTLYLAVAALYTLYFIWLVKSDQQATRHAQELADVDPHKRVDLTVNDYFFDDNFKD